MSSVKPLVLKPAGECVTPSIDLQTLGWNHCFHDSDKIISPKTAPKDIRTDSHSLNLAKNPLCGCSGLIWIHGLTVEKEKSCTHVCVRVSECMWR